MKARCEFQPFGQQPKCGRTSGVKRCPGPDCSYNLCPRHQEIHDRIHGAGDRFLAGLLGRPA